MLLLFLSVRGLAQHHHEQHDALQISPATSVSNASVSGSAFFTTDHHNNTVLCWTAGEKGKGTLYYAIFNKKKSLFESAVLVKPSAGTSINGESINKVAFKKDGTVVAVYERKHPTEKNKYAGSIYYSQSFDNGKTWTTEKYLHTDTVREYGRSYFDIVTLQDGEVAAVWLDGRNKKGNDGSTLYFSKTKGKTGFLPDKQIGETVCQCCRTDIAVDDKGIIHVIYRDIEPTIKGQVRDFVHTYSTDNGVTFSSIKKISNDNWVIAGCPHTGASMCHYEKTVGIVWFTAGGEPGLYFTQTNASGEFQQRQLLTSEGRHPQLTAWANDLALVCEEQNTTDEHGEEHESHGTMHNKSNDRLVLFLKKKNQNIATQTLDNDGSEFPVLTSINESDLLIAYTKDKKVWWLKVSR